MGDKIHIVLAPGNDPMSDTFVEIEDSHGNAIDIGDLVPRGDGTCAIVLDDPRARIANLTQLLAVAEERADANQKLLTEREKNDTLLMDKIATLRARIAELKSASFEVAVAAAAKQNELEDLRETIAVQERALKLANGSVRARDDEIATLRARIVELEADKARLGDVAADEGMRLFRDAWSALHAQVGSEAANVLSTMPGWGARMRRTLAADMKHTD